ncbi:MAG: antitoxin [Hydrogenoanaerobacterium sp.]
MSNILKISTPLIEKNPIQPNKQVVDPSIPFNLSDVSKVMKPAQQSEILKQNTGMIEHEDAPTILMNMLKDPAVTVGFLKNIYMLEEVIKLLPVNNNTVSAEIEQLFNALLVKPEQVSSEIILQEFASTSFKGELFDFLRQVLNENPKPEISYGIANLLKSINAVGTRQKMLGSVSNTLNFLADSVKSSTKLSASLRQLAQEYAQPKAIQRFTELKGRTLELMKLVEQSILYTPKLQKTVPLLTYNLSRVNQNPDFLREAAAGLITSMDELPQKEKLVKLLQEYLARDKAPAKESSQVMDALVKIISKEGEEKNANIVDAAKIEKIVHSLLSSPCNFTPLLHFIVPMQDEYMKAFAEIWVDPQDEEAGGGKDKTGIHFMVAFDVEGIGEFEAEMFVNGYDILLKLFCPPAYLAEFAGFGAGVKELLSGSKYRFSAINVDKLERHRSLMDVFKTLPHRRAGIDVTV